MIAAQHQRHLAVGQRSRHQLPQPSHAVGDLLQRYFAFGAARDRPGFPAVRQACCRDPRRRSQARRAACPVPPRARRKVPYRRRGVPAPRSSGAPMIAMPRLLLTAAAGTACAETRWSRAYAPGRRPTPRSARCPCRSRRAARCRTCAGRYTSRTLLAGDDALRCAAAASSGS